MVTQMAYGLIWLIELPQFLQDFDLLVLLVSAICHDIDHPGFNNAYQINCRTALALRSVVAKVMVKVKVMTKVKVW